MTDQLVGLERVLTSIEQSMANYAEIEPTTLRLASLESALSAVRSAVDHAFLAAQVLADDRPLAECFPDGSEPEFPLTPRQVLYLHLLFRANALGKLPERVCSLNTKSGKACSGRALGYVSRPVCTSHATEDERAFNRGKTSEARDVEMSAGECD